MTYDPTFVEVTSELIHLRVTASRSNGNTSKYVDTVTIFKKLYPKGPWPTMTLMWPLTTDIEKRSKNSYTALCNGVVSRKTRIGGIPVFTNHTRGNKHKQNASTIFTCYATFHRCLSSRSDRSPYVPDESHLFWSRQTPAHPYLEPHARIKMVQVLGSLVCICASDPLLLRTYVRVYLWIDVSQGIQICKYSNFFCQNLTEIPHTMYRKWSHSVFFEQIVYM